MICFFDNLQEIVWAFHKNNINVIININININTKQNDKPKMQQATSMATF